jgi:beta-galactosidase GanA
MDKKQLEEKIIENYQNDEKMMILIFAQWCINHDLDPIGLYQSAYPNQLKNHTLEETMELTVPKNEAEEISDETVLYVLQLFGNDDLAFVVQSEIEKRL